MDSLGANKDLRGRVERPPVSLSRRTLSSIAGGRVRTLPTSLLILKSLGQEHCFDQPITHSYLRISDESLLGMAPFPLGNIGKDFFRRLLGCDVDPQAYYLALSVKAETGATFSESDEYPLGLLIGIPEENRVLFFDISKVVFDKRARGATNYCSVNEFAKIAATLNYPKAPYQTASLQQRPK